MKIKDRVKECFL